MHPRWLRCSSLKYSRYSRSSRLAGGAPRPSRCDARLSPRPASVLSAPPAKNETNSQVVPREARLLEPVKHSSDGLLVGSRLRIVGLPLFDFGLEVGIAQVADVDPGVGHLVHRAVPPAHPLVRGDRTVDEM